MGLWSWLFPSPEDRVQNARRYLEQGRPDEARLEILEVDHPDAAEVLKAAETQLAEQNLDAALEYARAGDDDRVMVHLELAEQFHHGGLEEQFRATRRELREVRTAREEEAARNKQAQHQRLMSDEPPSAHRDPTFDAPGSATELVDEERAEIEQRVALLVENYPAALRPSVGELGGAFAQAVLDLEDGHPESAVRKLLALPDEQPLVQWERARAAHALGDPAAAARAARAFAKHAGGHYPMGRIHSGTYLAQLLTESGESAEALAVMRKVRATKGSRDEGGFLFGLLLLRNGHLQEAETVTKAMIQRSPKTMPLYRLLASVRLAGNHRTEAMRALEAGLEATHCSPGQCGFQPPDLEANRMLATLYLEDGIEPQRALELADVAAGLVQRPTWEDGYLRALVARARGETQVAQMAQQLANALPAEDPRRARAEALVA